MMCIKYKGSLKDRFQLIQDVNIKIIKNSKKFTFEDKKSFSKSRKNNHLKDEKKKSFGFKRKKNFFKKKEINPNATMLPTP